MRLKDVLEVSFGHVAIYEYHYDKHAHVEDIIPIYNGYAFEAIRADLDLNVKVSLIATITDGTIYIGTYAYEETEQLEF